MAASRHLDDSDDDLPSVKDLLHQRKQQPMPQSKPNSRSRKNEKPQTAAPSAAKAKEGTVRRRKLGNTTESHLLRPWSEEQIDFPAPHPSEPVKKSGPRVALRARKPKAPEPVVSELSDDEETVMEVTAVDDSVYFSLSDQESDDGDNDDDDNFEETKVVPKNTKSVQPKQALKPKKEKEDTGLEKVTKDPPRQNPQAAMQREGDDSGRRKSLEPPEPPNPQKKQVMRPSTPPPTTPPKPRPNGLVSPTKKPPRIPSTPHHPTSDAFWNQQITDDWNEKHSPKKLFQPKPMPPPSPSKKDRVGQREAKKSFESSKHEIASKFLRELDDAITDGKIAQMTDPTGGVQIRWSNKLKTTAGVASYRKDTSRRKTAAGEAAAVAGAVVATLHNAHIDLAEKVIDCEDRLLNVLAHEFCHLATFMVSGVLDRPHGREFKSWAAACSRAFGDRGIVVTTKHSYEIDFKYVWECAACAIQYKRHSRSIDTSRHRCGGCKGMLEQIKPVPRAKTGTAPSKYQVFMKEQMKLIREENPGSPQKDIMKQVAERWAQKTGSVKTGGSKGADRVGLVEELEALNLDD